MQEYFSILRIDKKGNKKYLSLKDFKPALGICDITFTKDDRKQAWLTRDEINFVCDSTGILHTYKNQLFTVTLRPPVEHNPKLYYKTN